MRTGLAKLKKLRRMRTREINARSRQELRKLGERVFGFSAYEMSDATFLSEVNPGSRNCSAEGTAGSISERIRSQVFSGGRLILPSFGQRSEIVAALDRLFPGERRAIIDRAERAISGRFNLLGLEDISFGDPIDWHLEPLSGRRSTLKHWSKIDFLDPAVAGDKKVTWELNRHQHFVTLGQAYSITGDERYAAAFVKQATSWIDANPPKFGINWASSLEVALRSIAWVWALHLFAGSTHVTPAFMLRMLKCLSAHAGHIESYLSHYFSPNTHLTGEALGLFYTGTALPELRRAEGWRNLGLKILIEQLPRQVRSDGVYFEQATYYHRYTTDFYTHLFVIAQANQLLLPVEVGMSLARMHDHLMWITEPDGRSPLLGDDDGGRLIILSERKLDDFRDTLATGAALFGRGDWKYLAGDPAVEILWLLGPEGLTRYEEIEGEPPPEQSRAFKESGYYVMRDGWLPSSSYVILDSGPHGADGCGHAHSDALALNFASMGKTWLVDPGTFTYTADFEARNEFRLTEAHNTVTVDGQPQSTPAGPFSWGHIAQANTVDFIAESDFDYFEGAHNGYERLADPVKHNRAVLFIKSRQGHSEVADQPSYLIIRDTFTARRLHGYEIRFHFPPGFLATADGNRVIATEQGGSRLQIIAFGCGLIRPQITKGWVSRAYRQREESPVAVLKAEGDGPQEFLTFVIPSIKERSVYVEQANAGLDSRGFYIMTEGLLDVVLTSDGQTEANAGPLTGCARMAWGRFRDDKLVGGCMIGGRALEAGGGFALQFTDRVRYCAVQRTGDCFEVMVNATDRFTVMPQQSGAEAISGVVE